MTHQTPDPADVLHMACKAYPGGITALAALIGRSAGILHNKFSDATPQYEVSLREAITLAWHISQKTGSTVFIEAMCAAFGGVFIPLPADGEAADDDVLNALLEAMLEFGSLAQETRDAKADGIVTREEFDHISAHGAKLISRLHAFLHTLESQVRELPTDQPTVRVVK